MEEHVTPRYRVAVDEDACGNAIDCLKCVKTCLDHGPNVLGYMNKEAPDLDKYIPRRLEDIDHKIISGFMINCDGCGECVAVCPRSALTLVVPEPQVPRALIPRDGSIVLCGTLADGTEIFPD
ncbi:MAG: 4Fe-4S dicluster domain-containing protein [Syntrophaceae bacterium]|nr:4Fe-4S dicluster domain-containing protein [Syntrophaceae bacterium]